MAHLILQWILGQELSYYQIFLDELFVHTK